MKTFESKIEKLIDALERVLLNRAYLEKLRLQREEEISYLLQIEKDLKLIVAEMEKLENIQDIPIPFLGKIMKSDYKEYSEDYLYALESYRQLEKLIQSIDFQIKVLEEQVAKEPKLQKQLTNLVKDREDWVNSMHAEVLRELLYLFEQLDQHQKWQREFEEVIREGERVIKQLQDILHNIQNKLMKVRRVRSIRGYHQNQNWMAVRSEKTIHEIWKQAGEVKKSLRSFNKELDDVVDNEGHKPLIIDQVPQYYSSLAVAELLLKSMAKEKRFKAQSGSLQSLLNEVLEINGLFQQELERLERERKALVEEKEELLIRTEK